MKGVYVAGDGLYGPATVVEGIRDGKMAAEAIVGKVLAEDSFKLSDAYIHLWPQGQAGRGE